MRGILCHLLLSFVLNGITPACAGNTDQQKALTAFEGDHPRVCGEYVAADVKPVIWSGSPPRVRGILTTKNAARFFFRITPACAGNTSTSFQLSGSP